MSIKVKIRVITSFILCKERYTDGRLYTACRQKYLNRTDEIMTRELLYVCSGGGYYRGKFRSDESPKGYAVFRWDVAQRAWS